MERGEAIAEITATLVVGDSSVKVFRVYGGDAKPAGFSWTPDNPASIPNFRDAAGLPSGGTSGATNTGQFVIEGTVKNKHIITRKMAEPLDGNTGGAVKSISSIPKMLI